MPLHERLRPPTLELPAPKAGHGLAAGMAFTVLAAGFAFAMPRALQVTSEEAPAPVEVLEEEQPEVDPKGVVVSGADLDATHEDAEGAGEEKVDNHGQVVSSAAHCEVKGRALGALVSSIAKDKDATLEDVAAACAAAAATDPDANNKGGRAPEHSRGERAAEPEMGKSGGNRRDDEHETSDADISDEEDSENTESTEDSEEPGDSEEEADSDDDAGKRDKGRSKKKH